MTSNRTDVAVAVRDMVERTAQHVEASGSASHTEGQRVESYVTEASPDRRRRLPAALAVVAAAAALAVAGAVFLSDPAHQETTDPAHQETTDPAARPAKVPPPRPRDMYDEALVDITGTVALPAEQPPGVEWVFLTAVNGQQNFVAQSGDILIAVCPTARCNYEGQEVLRAVDVGGEQFQVVQYPANKMPPFELAPLPDDYKRFWHDVELVSERPGWLRAEHTPGGLLDPDEVGG